MTENELDAILDNLDRGKRRSHDIKIAQAQAELKAIEREYLAYYDGAYDAIKAVRVALQKESDVNCG